MHHAYDLRPAGVCRRPDPESRIWRNGWFPPIDGIALYTYLSRRNPKIYLEIGSGNSTKFARKAIKDNHLRTKIISIDPQPRTEVEALVDVSVRSPLEKCDLGVFGGLEDNDVVLFDGSHRCFQNSDVTIFFLEVLPALPARLLVGVHDIFLPRDYPPAWRERYYNEQYMLATYLIGARDNLAVEFPAAYCARRYQSVVAELLPPAVVEAEISYMNFIAGTSFWFTKSRGAVAVGEAGPGVGGVGAPAPSAVSEA